MVLRPEARMKILIGYDGSECAEVAVRDLPRAGLPTDTEALVLSVADLLVEVPFAGAGVPGVPMPVDPVIREIRELAEEAMKEARETCARGRDLIASLFPGWTVRSEAVADSPYWALVKKADGWAADLVVVGSHGRSAMGRLYMGSVSQNVLNHAACSVRIGRCGRERTTPGDGAPERIILAVDGSPDSATAAEELARRRWQPGAEARVVTAVDMKASAALLGLGGRIEPMEQGHDVRSIAEFRARAVARALGAKGLAATPVVLDGDPKRVLVEEAERWDADCIFLGAKGHSRIERFLLGSVSAAVATRARCSVEVVRQR